MSEKPPQNVPSEPNIPSKPSEEELEKEQEFREARIKEQARIERAVRSGDIRIGEVPGSREELEKRVRESLAKEKEQEKRREAALILDLPETASWKEIKAEREKSPVVKGEEISYAEMF